MLIFSITDSVNFSQPIFLCELAFPDSTVKTLFKSNTPCLAQFSNNPSWGISFFISLFNSL